jgi:hypothetical protein
MKIHKILLTILLGCVSWNVSALELSQLQMHGFASQGYLRSNHYDYLGAQTDKGTVEFNEFGLNVMSNLTDRLRFGIQLLARDLGNDGNDKITIDWAFGDYRYRNWLGLRVGQFPRALGLYNQSRDIDAARTGVFLPFSVYNEVSRHLQKSIKGIELYGTLPGGFEYQGQYGTVDANYRQHLMDLFSSNQVEVANDTYTFHLKWNTPLDGLRLVGTTFDNFFFSATQTVNGAAVTSKVNYKQRLVGIEYTRGKVTCAAEYTERTFKNQGTRTSHYTGTGYYGLLSYRFTDWFELGTSYAVSYANKDDKAGKSYAQRGQPKALAWSKDLAVSARFDVNEYWIVKLEGHWINGLNGVSNYGTNPSEDGFLGAVKVTFSF